MKRHRPNRILTDADLQAAFDQGEIFHKGTWDPANLRGTAYDLRMATDLMVVPDPPKFPTGRYYPRGATRHTEIILKPGDVAFVSTMEKLCIPWDVTGLLGSKFSVTSRGILILTGLFVDPGFGLRQDADGSWGPKDDERLHFLIANVGPSDMILAPGKQVIAAIQFWQIDEPLAKREVKSGGFQNIVENVLPANEQVAAGLVFFRTMAELRQDFGAFEKEVKHFKQEIHDFEGRLRTVETSSNQIVMFGLYLMFITMLGVAFAVILSTVQMSGFEARILTAQRILLNGWAVLLFAGLSVVGLSVLVIKALRTILRVSLKLANGLRRD